jgi:hypothetical protein
MKAVTFNKVGNGKEKREAGMTARKCGVVLRITEVREACLGGAEIQGFGR